EVNTAADLARLQNEDKILTPQELKELSTRIKALEDMAKMEDQLKALDESTQDPMSPLRPWPLKHHCLLEAPLFTARLRDAPRQRQTIQILTRAHPPLPLSIATKDDASQKASRLYQAILSELARAFENGGTGKKTLKEFLKETLLPIGPEPRRFSRPWTT